MGLPKDLINRYPGLDDWAILVAYRGSLVHGTYLPNSESTSVDDKDVMSICVPPLEYYFGLKEFGSRGTQEIKQDEWDIVIYEVRKFINLLVQGNPNVLCMLWLRPNDYIMRAAAGDLLIANRKLFVGRHVYRSFCGYAHGQLHRMTHTQFHGHMGQKRKQLVEKFGFDCKNGSHLIRLLRMGTEFLKDGEMYVHRHDATQLLEIKRGEWTLEQVLAEADRWFKLAEEAYVASTLPVTSDRDAINTLAVKVVELAMEELYEYKSGF